MKSSLACSAIDDIEFLGVHLLPEWVQACFSESKTSSQNNIDSDVILHQVLHSDLREVVASNSRENTNSKLPRDTIKISFFDADMNNQSCKVTLPISFTCLVQVEELVSQ